jgi:hypothetical protein
LGLLQLVIQFADCPRAKFAPRKHYGTVQPKC